MQLVPFWRHIALILSAVVFSQAAQSETVYPEEFADFFAEVEQLTSIKVNGLHTGIEIESIVNFDSFRIENPSSAAILRAYFEQNLLKPQYIEQILEQAQQGIVADAECTGTLLGCKPLAQPGEVRYVYDFDNSVVVIFVPVDAFLPRSFDAEYQSPWSVNNALINNTNLNVSYDGADQQSLNWSNQTTLGLPIGYLTMDSQFSAYRGNNEYEDFEVYSVLYDAEYNDVRLQAGRSRYNLSFNTTDYLNNGINLSGDVVAIGRSQNLLVGEAANQQQFEFYSPQNAVLEVYRGDDLILSRVVSEGVHKISYLDLPKGVYQATGFLKAGGEIILQRTAQIVNNNQFVLPLNQWDYALSGGVFEEQDNNTEATYQDYNRAYGRALVNYRATRSLFVGGGITSDENDQYLQLGGSLYIGDKFSTDYSAGWFTSDEFYQTARISYSPLFIDYRQFESDLTNTTYRLSEELYGDGSYWDVGIGTSFEMPVIGGNTYTRYSLYHTENGNQTDGVNGIDGINEDDRAIITLGYSRAFLTGDLSINIDYTDNDTEDNTINTTVSWSKELGSDVSAQVAFYGTQDGFSQNTNSLRYAYRGEDLYASLSAGAQVDKDNQTSADLSLSANGSTQFADIGAYGYASSDSQSASLSLSGSQVFTLDGVALSNQTSTSFAKVEIEAFEQANLNSPVQLTVKRDSQYSHRIDLQDGDELIPLDNYTSLVLELDKATNNIELENRSLATFVHPGTVHSLNSEMVKLLSRTIVFDDIYNQPIEDLTCVGEGCVDVEPVSNDGVFRVNYRAGKPIRLVSSKGLCLFDEASQDDFSFGFCLPSVDKETLQWATPEEFKQRYPQSSRLDGKKSKNNQQVMLYLGDFNSGNESKNITQQLETEAIDFKRFEIGEHHYYYIIEVSQFTEQQQVVLEQISTYVHAKQFDKDTQFGFESPANIENKTSALNATSLN